MPIYEYECRACSVRFERFQRFSDEPLAACPECGGQVRRVLHPVGIVFKGSGWYITDSRKSESVSVPTKADSGTENGKGEGSSESSAAATGAAKTAGAD